MLTIEHVELVFDALLNEKNEYGDPCLLKVGIDPKTCTELYRPNIGIKGLLKLLTKYESKLEFKLTIEAMIAEMLESTIEDLDTAMSELEKRELLPMIMKNNPKTAEIFMELNRGSRLKIPNALTLFYDICTILIRLSQEKEWILVSEIYKNIEDPEYVADWHEAVLVVMCYAASQGIIEPRGDSPSNLEVRLVNERKTNIIKQFLNIFDRPDFDDIFQKASLKLADKNKINNRDSNIGF
jgi:hypothetical protein